MILISNDFDNSTDIMKKSMRSSNDFDNSTDIMKKIYEIFQWFW